MPFGFFLNKKNLIHPPRPFFTDHAVQCTMCKFKAPRTKFVYKANGKFFLCLVNKGSISENDSITFLRVCPCKDEPVQVNDFFFFKIYMRTCRYNLFFQDLRSS